MCQKCPIARNEEETIDPESESSSLDDSSDDLEDTEDLEFAFMEIDMSI